MSQNQLSIKQIDSALPLKKEYFLSDGNGLHLRIRPAGDKLWVFRYTNPLGKQVKMSLGPYPDTPLDLARKLVSEHKAKLALGIDPKIIKNNAPTTVQDLFSIWITEELPSRRTERGIYQTRIRFAKHILCHIGDAKLISLKKSDFLNVFTRVVNQGSNAQANLLLREMRQMFDYAVTNEWLDANRIRSIKKSEVGGPDRVGTRVLSKKEIRELWLKCNQKTGITLQCHASIWLALATMARIEEIVTAEEQDFDLENNLWIIPANKNQSKRKHVIYLSPFARQYIDLLISVPREGSSYLFKSVRSTTYTRPKTINFQISHRQDCSETADITSKLSPELKSSLRISGGRWSHQDLRRSGAALMSSLKIPYEIIEQCLNRKPKQGHIAIYQQIRPAEQRHAFLKLGKALEKITAHVCFGAAHSQGRL